MNYEEYVVRYCFLEAQGFFILCKYFHGNNTSIKARAGKINPLLSTTTDNLFKLSMAETLAALSKVFN